MQGSALLTVNFEFAIDLKDLSFSISSALKPSNFMRSQRERHREREREREREIEIDREREKIEIFIFPQQDLSKDRTCHTLREGSTHRSYNVKLQLGQSVG